MTHGKCVTTFCSVSNELSVFTFTGVHSVLQFFFMAVDNFFLFGGANFLSKIFNDYIATP